MTRMREHILHLALLFLVSACCAVVSKLPEGPMRPVMAELPFECAGAETITYRPNDTLLACGNLRQGVKDGYWAKFYENGGVMYDGFFCLGEVCGFWHGWNAARVLVWQG